MPLEENQVAAMFVARSVPEVIEPYIVQGCRGSKTSDVSAQLGCFLIGSDDHCQGVPANEGANSPLQSMIAIASFFMCCWYGIDVCGGWTVWNMCSRAARGINQCFDQKMSAIVSFPVNHAGQCI